jgi:peroxiredoxin Q/BCP
MITPGQRLDLSFPVQSVRDGAREESSFARLVRRRTVVSVYMRNNTGSCDRQIASLAAAAPVFAELGFDVIAVSRDTCASHLKYAAKHGVAFTLVSDPEDAFSRAADAMVEKSMYGKKYLGPARAAYVLEPDGTVLAVIEKVDTADHAAQLRAVLATLPAA